MMLHDAFRGHDKTTMSCDGAVMSCWRHIWMLACLSNITVLILPPSFLFWKCLFYKAFIVKTKLCQAVPFQRNKITLHHTCARHRHKIRSSLFIIFPGINWIKCLLSITIIDRIHVFIYVIYFPTDSHCWQRESGRQQITKASQVTSVLMVLEE